MRALKERLINSQLNYDYQRLQSVWTSIVWDYLSSKHEILALVGVIFCKNSKVLNIGNEGSADILWVLHIVINLVVELRHFLYCPNTCFAPLYDATFVVNHARQLNTFL